MLDYKIDIDTLDWINAGTGIRYKVHKNKDVQLRVIEFSEGLEHRDWCQVGHTAIILEGCLEIQFESLTEIYEPGSILVIPEGEKHKHIPRPLSPLVRMFSVEKP